MAIPNSTEAFGKTSFWGFSRALDLSSYFPAMSTAPVPAARYNILLMGVCDLRHVIKTISSLNKNKEIVDIHFYMIENRMELVARHILFLGLVHEQAESLGIQEKTELFLELFGNLLIRQQTVDYLHKKCKILMEAMTNLELASSEFPYMDLTPLKFKERDELESIFKLWYTDSIKPQDAMLSWENRVRDFLSVRYDSRSAIYDWDYSMKLVDVVKTISSHEYSTWRETGNAFVIRSEDAYTLSNSTLSSTVVVRKGRDTIEKKGYWGDIIVSPYIAFATHTTCKELMKTVTLPYARSAQQISVDNLQSMLEYLLVDNSNNVTNSKLSENKTLHENNKCKMDDELQADGKFTENVDEKAPAIDILANTDSNLPIINHNDVIINLPIGNVHFVVHFLPFSSAETLHTKPSYRHFFSMIYFSTFMAHHLKPDTSHLFVPQSAGLLMETTTNMIGISKEQHSMYSDKLISIASSIRFHLQITQPDHLFFLPEEQLLPETTDGHHILTATTSSELN